MEKPKIIIRLGASMNQVTVIEGAQATHFNRSTMDRQQQEKLRRMLVAGWSKANER